jgi:hypothetical protein
VVFTLSVAGFAAGRVSIGLIHATPGDMKSFRSSAERMALMVAASALNAPPNSNTVDPECDT